MRIDLPRYSILILNAPYQLFTCAISPELDYVHFRPLRFAFGSGSAEPESRPALHFLFQKLHTHLLPYPLVLGHPLHLTYHLALRARAMLIYLFFKNTV